MGILEVIVIGFVLSIDAFCASITCGIKLHQIILKHYLKIAIAFGLFQSLMPILGYLCGGLLKNISYQNYVAAAVFLILGIKTIVDSLKKEDEENLQVCACQRPSCLLALAIATSIDAFVVGIVFSLYSVNIISASILIAIITLCMAFMGCFIGQNVKKNLGKKAEFIAGLILIALSVKVFVM